MKLLESQNKFKIFVVGTGGTGSQLIPFLMQLLNNHIEDEHKITLIDGDIIESKNLKNQKFSYFDVSQPKSKVLCERYQTIYKDINISYIDNYILNKETLINLINGMPYKYTPILISCVDNNASRRLFNEVFYDKSIKNIIYVDSGNGTKNRNGQVVVGYKATINNIQYEILKPVCKIFKNILKDNDSLKSLTSCVQLVDKYPQNIATNVMAATTIFTIMNEIISFNEINTHIAYFDAQNTSILNRSVKDVDYKNFIKEKNIICVA